MSAEDLGNLLSERKTRELELHIAGAGKSERFSVVEYFNYAGGNWSKTELYDDADPCLTLEGTGWTDAQLAAVLAVQRQVFDGASLLALADLSAEERGMLRDTVLSAVRAELRLRSNNRSHHAQ